MSSYIFEQEFECQRDGVHGFMWVTCTNLCWESLVGIETLQIPVAKIAEVKKVNWGILPTGVDIITKEVSKKKNFLSKNLFPVSSSSTFFWLVQ
jgi:hypothetical protein